MGSPPQRFPGGGRRKPAPAGSRRRRVSLRCRSPEGRPGGLRCPPSPRQAVRSCQPQVGLLRAPAAMVGGEAEEGGSAQPAPRGYFGRPPASAGRLGPLSPRWGVGALFSCSPGPIQSCFCSAPYRNVLSAVAFSPFAFGRARVRVSHLE